MTEKEISEIFRENKLHYYWFVHPETHLLHVEVDHGDWKHDHLFLDYTMRNLGFTLAATVPFGEPTGDDSYSATHIYVM